MSISNAPIIAEIRLFKEEIELTRLKLKEPKGLLKQLEILLEAINLEK